MYNASLCIRSFVIVLLFYSTAPDTVSYTYGDSDWGDLLTQYDGIRVYYDAIGNMTRYSTTSFQWEHGRELSSMGVAADLVILEQPEDFTGILDDEITFSVSAQGEGLTYQWQLSNNNGKTWGNSTSSGYNTPTIYNFFLSEARDGRLYRCKITDADGNVLYSEPAEIILVPIAIRSQPTDFYGEIGDTFSFSVDADGDGLTYQWQVSTNNGRTWGNSSAGGYTTASMWVALTEARAGYLYRCKITDADGNTVYSEPGRIRTDPIAILSQPEDFVGVVGDTVRFTVEAQGEGLTYQWQVSTNNGRTWGNSSAGGYATASMWVALTEARVGNQYRCKITDTNGNVVYSEPGEIKVAQVNWNFTYDANGMRTKRTNGTTTYEYVYNGSSLSYMSVDGNTLYFSYGADGHPVCVLYNGTKYFYVTNLQGDVTAILNSSGAAVAEYTYDAWGNILTTSGTMADTLGKQNPLRYRSYVYDQETKLYYLSSRYYDPEVGRFINADAFTSTGQGILGNNMFAYCANNPVCRCDPSGWAFTDIFAICYNDGGFPGIVSAISDGKEQSDALLQHVLDYYIPSCGYGAKVSVSYMGTYSHTSTVGLDIAVSAVGKIVTLGMSYVSSGGLFTVLQFVSGAVSVYGDISLINSALDPLVAKDYHQYMVTVSWTQIDKLNFPPGAVRYSEYSAEMIFLWVDNRHGSEYWYTQDLTVQINEWVVVP